MIWRLWCTCQGTPLVKMVWTLWKHVLDQTSHWEEEIDCLKLIRPSWIHYIAAQATQVSQCSRRPFPISSWGIACQIGKECVRVIIGKRKAITSGNWSFNSHHNELMRTLKGLKRWKMQLTKFWTQITERMWCEFVSCSFSWIKQTKMAQIESVNIISQHEILG